jgi:hypothetical protein
MNLRRSKENNFTPFLFKDDACDSGAFWQIGYLVIWFLDHFLLDMHLRISGRPVIITDLSSLFIEPYAMGTTWR